MSDAYAARGTRQTGVFTAIAAFHFAIFLVITIAPVPRVFDNDPLALPITPLAPEGKSNPVLGKPDVNLDSFTVEISVAEPVFEVPRFDDAESASEVSREAVADAAGTTGSPAALAGDVAPRLRTRSENLAALISSCYPAASRRLNEEGRVVAHILIDAQGDALHWSIAQSSGFPRLDEATACILGKLAFVAGRRDGQTVAAEAMLPIVFRLD